MHSIYTNATILEKYPGFTTAPAYPFLPPKQDLDTYRSNLDSAFNSIVFSGSFDANDGAVKVYWKASQIEQLYLEWKANHPDPATPRPVTPTDNIYLELQKFEDKSNTLFNEMADFNGKFVEAARKDLGLPPHF